MNTHEAECKVCHRPTSDTAWLCADHTAELERIIAELPALLAEVAVTAARRDRITPTSSPRRRPVEQDPDPATEPHTRDRPDLGVKVQALPVHVDASALGRKVLVEVGTWVRHLAESRGRAVDVKPTPQSLSLWLLRAMSSIRLDEACGDLFADARSWRAVCRSVVDSREDRVYVGQCRAQADDWCCARDLWAPVGADEIVCDGWGATDGAGCYAVHTAAGRHAMLREEFRGAELTWEEAVRAIPGVFPGPMPPSVLLRLWKSRGEAVGSQAEPRALTDGGGDLRMRHGEPLWLGEAVLGRVETWRLLNRDGKSPRGRYAGRRAESGGVRCA